MSKYRWYASSELGKSDIWAGLRPTCSIFQYNKRVAYIYTYNKMNFLLNFLPSQRGIEFT